MKTNVFKQFLLEDKHFVEVRHNLTRENFDQKKIDDIFKHVSERILLSGQKAFPRQKSQKRKKSTKPWYTKKCKSIRQILRQKCREFSKDPFCVMKKDTFLKARALYKKTCRQGSRTST